LRKFLKKLSSLVWEATTMGFRPARAKCLARTSWKKPGPTSRMGSPCSSRSLAAREVEEEAVVGAWFRTTPTPGATKALVVAANGATKSPNRASRENMMFGPF
jgi:hypothetical protein